MTNREDLQTLLMIVWLSENGFPTLAKYAIRRLRNAAPTLHRL
jgi:hypothetical protein